METVNILCDAITEILRIRYPSSGYVSMKMANNTKCAAGYPIWFASVEVQPDPDMIDCYTFAGEAENPFDALMDLYNKVVAGVPERG